MKISWRSPQIDFSTCWIFLLFVCVTVNTARRDPRFVSFVFSFIPDGLIARTMWSSLGTGMLSFSTSPSPSSTSPGATGLSNAGSWPQLPLSAPKNREEWRWGEAALLMQTISQAKLLYPITFSIVPILKSNANTESNWAVEWKGSALQKQMCAISLCSPC